MDTNFSGHFRRRMNACHYPDMNIPRTLPKQMHQPEQPILATDFADDTDGKRRIFQTPKFRESSSGQRATALALSTRKGFFAGIQAKNRDDNFINHFKFIARDWDV